jgi:hypothetical protein
MGLITALRFSGFQVCRFSVPASPLLWLSSCAAIDFLLENKLNENNNKRIDFLQEFV